MTDSMTTTSSEKEELSSTKNAPLEIKLQVKPKEETQLEVESNSQAQVQKEQPKVDASNITFGEAQTQTSTQAPLYYDSGMNDYSLGNYLSGIGLVVVMLAFLYALLWFLRKYGKGNFLPIASKISRNDLRLEAQLPLGPKKTLYVVRYLNKRILLGATDSQITHLSEDYILDEDDDNSAPVNQENFKEVVEHFTDDKR